MSTRPSRTASTRLASDCAPDRLAASASTLAANVAVILIY
jgi:hypothetical protein